MGTGPLYVGIDVSKAQLDVAERPSGERAVIPHIEQDIATLVEQLRIRHPACVVLEATGGLPVALASALAVAGIPVAVVNPRQVRDFARATGQLAKTAAIDAHILARFAEAVRPTPRPLPDEATRAFSALLTRRRQLIDMLVVIDPMQLEDVLGQIDPDARDVLHVDSLLLVVMGSPCRSVGPMLPNSGGVHPIRQSPPAAFSRRSEAQRTELSTASLLRLLRP